MRTHIVTTSVSAIFFLLQLPIAIHGINIISSNDDGWAEINLRTLYSTLSAAGHDVVVSAPAQNESGTGKSNLCSDSLFSLLKSKDISTLQHDSHEMLLVSCI